jgi:pyrimidine operon attenuation protein/uracil phosphoribosyltransferase
MNQSTNDIEQWLSTMADQLGKLINKESLMIGIQTGGVWIAERLHNKLQLTEPLGQLNIAFYRDDFSHIGLHPRVTPSNLPFSVENREIILVDDVLHTGRTIRAALNEIFDYGRPARVILVALIERGGKELPICADVIGKRMSLKANEHVKLSGPEPLALEIKTAE